MVFNPETGIGGHKYLAQTVQSHPPASDAKYEAAGARNPFREWYITKGLDSKINLISSFRS